jgi:hypothetical protein
MDVFLLSVPIINSIKEEKTDEKNSAEEETHRHISIAYKSGVSLWTER